MQKIILLILVIVSIFSLSIVLPVARAEKFDLRSDIFEKQLPAIKDETGLPGANKTEDRMMELVTDVIKALLGFMAVIFMILILYSGFRWMTSGGNAEQVDGAKKVIKSALIGLLIIFFAYAITHFVFAIALVNRWGW